MPRRAAPLPAFMSRQVAEARRFHLVAVPGTVRGPLVVCAGWERSARDYRISRPGFRYFGLEFVVGGRGVLLMGGRTHALERGTVFAYGPGIAHEITTDPQDRLSKYFVDFSGAGALAAMRSAGIAPGTCHTLAAVDEIQAVFEQLLAAGRRGTPASAQIAALHGQILLLLMGDVRLPRSRRSQVARDTFLRCRTHLETHFATVRTAEEAAAACGVAPAYLSRLFQRFARQSAYPFLMRLKMNHAATLLERQGATVGEAAEALGLDAFHFSRAFKRVHGRPPVHFRTARPQ